MNFSAVLVVARKELKDVLRDRRTLIFMMLLPIAVMPLMMLGISKFMMKQAQAKQAREVNVLLDESGRNTLTALARRWFQDNRLALGVVESQAGLDALGGMAGLARMFEGGGDEGGAVEEPVGMAEFLKAAADAPPEHQALQRDLGAVIAFRHRTRFLAADELPAGGELAPGVEIPSGLPGGLGEPVVTIAIQNKDLDAALYVPADALVTLEDADRSVPFHVLYDSSQSISKEAFERFSAFVAAVNRDALRIRLDDQSLPRDFAEPVRLEQANVATSSRKVQAFLGGLLPYLLFAFCFFGALYPALDVTAGEKERFTLETLLLAPVSRLEIAVGKFLVVFLAAIVAAVLTTTSMVVTFTHGILPEGMSEAFDIDFQPLALLLTGSLVLPVAALYSSLLLAVGLYARSFKEAQSYSVPLQFVLILPMMISLLPDVEAESHLAWIPFVNISMLMKELLKGNYLWQFYGITFASTLVLTLAALFGAARMFRREGVLLRT